jgi:hypothetical protein
MRSSARTRERKAASASGYDCFSGQLGVLAGRDEDCHRAAVARDLQDATVLGKAQEIGKLLTGLGHGIALGCHG